MGGGAAAPYILGGLGLASSFLGGGEKSDAPQIPPAFQAFLSSAFGPMNAGLAGQAQATQGFQGPFAAPFGSLGQAALQGFERFGAGDVFRASQGQLGEIAESGGMDPRALAASRRFLRPSQLISERDFTRQTRAADAARGNLFSTGSVETETTGLARLRSEGERDILQTALSNVDPRLAAIGQIQRGPQFFESALQAAEAERQVRQRDVTGGVDEFRRLSPIEYLKVLPGVFGAPTYQPTYGPGIGETLLNTLGQLAPMFGGGGSKGKGKGTE